MPSQGRRSGPARRECRGGVGEKNVWGKQAEWVDYAGTIGSEPVGVVMMDHPTNPRHPTYWHSRIRAALDQPVRVARLPERQDPERRHDHRAGQHVRFRYRAGHPPGPVGREDRGTSQGLLTSKVGPRVPRGRCHGDPHAKEVNRRHFLMGSVALPTVLRATARAQNSPNDTVRVAVVGCDGRGKATSTRTKMPNVEIAALCDVDESRSGAACRIDAEARARSACRPSATIRKVLEDKTIDAVSIATPEPLAHAADHLGLPGGQGRLRREARARTTSSRRAQIVAAARKYNRIVQHGSQSRSSAGAAGGACRRCGTAIIGEVYMARGLCFKWRDTIGKTPDGAGARRRRLRPVDRARARAPVHQEPLPLQLALVLGLRQRRLGNQGIHEMDIAALGPGRDATRPRSARWAASSCSTTTRRRPTRMVATFEFDDGGKKKMMVFEVRHWISNHEAGIGDGRHAGRVRPGNNHRQHLLRLEGLPGHRRLQQVLHLLGKDQKPGPARRQGGDNWFENFIDVVRSRKREDLTRRDRRRRHSRRVDAPGEHLLPAGPHAATSTRRPGQCKGDAEATAMFARPRRARRSSCRGSPTAGPSSSRERVA